ncbi:hypothetical protein AZSI13_13300 [Azospira sp. I13]|uniref:hypothetical protein n=1 Tax=Azospira sp. I13 TaxID=1765050 RepID=UPI000D3F4BD5|nr:hypothetical protein [Azospira sp. I13]GBG02003.1 hypothetical protein AZSI13_13300 [Azospira sp. I13]
MIQPAKERMETVGVRFPVSDIEWLASLQVKGAVTPSDKIRHLIAEARRQEAGTADLETCLAWARDLVAPFNSHVRREELLAGEHSELLALLGDWLPLVLALCLAGDNSQDLIRRENSLAKSCFQLLEGVLRLGVSNQAPCYDPNVINRYLPRILELAEIIATARKSGNKEELHHG